MSHEATKEEIEKAYRRMISVLNIDQNPELKILSDDLRMYDLPIINYTNRAYETLINEVSRAEYDEYVSQHIKLSRLWGKKIEEEIDEEELERRRRGKKANDYNLYRAREEKVRRGLRLCK